jgi:hypothetical protein
MYFIYLIGIQIEVSIYLSNCLLEKAMYKITRCWILAVQQRILNTPHDGLTLGTVLLLEHIEVHPDSTKSSLHYEYTYYVIYLHV